MSFESFIHQRNFENKCRERERLINEIDRILRIMDPSPVTEATKSYIGDELRRAGFGIEEGFENKEEAEVKEALQVCAKKLAEYSAAIIDLR